MGTKQRQQEMQYSCSMDNVAFLMTTEDPHGMLVGSEVRRSEKSDMSRFMSGQQAAWIQSRSNGPKKVNPKKFVGQDLEHQTQTDGLNETYLGLCM